MVDPQSEEDMDLELELLLDATSTSAFSEMATDASVAVVEEENAFVTADNDAGAKAEEKTDVKKFM